MNRDKIIALLRNPKDDGGLIIAATILNTLPLDEVIEIFDKACNYEFLSHDLSEDERFLCKGRIVNWPQERIPTLGRRTKTQLRIIGKEFRIFRNINFTYLEIISASDVPSMTKTVIL